MLIHHKISSFSCLNGPESWSEALTSLKDIREQGAEEIVWNLVGGSDGRTLSYGELRNLHCTTYEMLFMLFRSNTRQGLRVAARIIEKRKAYKILMGNSKGKGPPGRPCWRRKKDDNEIRKEQESLWL